MKRKQFLQIALLLTVSFVFNACSSSQLNKLEGKWELFWINDLSDPNIYIWEFANDQITITIFEPITPANPTPQPRLGGRADYKTVTSFLDASIEVSGYTQSISDAKVNAMIFNGTWTIAKIDREVLRLRGGQSWVDTRYANLRV